MRRPRVYTAQPLAANRVIALDSGPAHHLARVLRMQPGQALRLFNGDGRDYPALVERIDKRGMSVAVSDPVEASPESPLAIELGIAVSKGERMDWVVQKATELGVATLAPLWTERVEVRLKGEREERKHQHWQNVAIAACEQCGRNRLPVIQAPATLADWLAGCSADQRLVLHHRAGTALDAAARPARVALLIGPEGGLAEREIAQAEQAGFTALQLGPRVLRTETAPLAALSVLQYVWGDLG